MVRFLFLFFAILNLSFSFDDEIELQSIEDLSKFAPKSDTKKLDNRRINIKMSEREFKNKGEINLDDLSMLAPTNEEELDIRDDVYQEVAKKELSIQTDVSLKQAYVNQIFKIDILVNLGQDIFVEPKLTLKKSDDLKWLNENNVNWIIGEDVVETTLWFEANTTKSFIDDINVILNKNGELFQQISTKPNFPKILPIQAKKDYANISADELKIKSVKTTNFDDNSILMTINLNVKNANLSSFYVENENIIKQSIDSVRGSYANQNGFYMVVLNNNVKNFEFKYFNLQTKKFESFSLDARPESSDLSTHVDLNPKESKFEIYKIIALYSISALFLVMFIASKNITPLIFALIMIGVSFYIQKPYGVGMISKNSIIRILPMTNATPFYITQKDESVEILYENDKYYKILLSNNKIGWIEKNEVRKD